MNDVPFFDYKKVYLDYQNHLNNIFTQVSSKGKFILQEEVEKFELNLCTYHGCKYSLGVANATDAMLLLLLADNIGSGDEILFCSHTLVATASVIKLTGARPIPVNCNDEYLMDVNDLKKKISSRTKGIFVTHLNGRIADMKQINKIAKKFKLNIYEDAAQAICSTYYGKAAGTFDRGGCISFYPAKILGCLGDGGAVITNNKKIYERIKLLRDHGRKNLEVFAWGLNSRLDNLQAGFLNFLITKLKQNIMHRRKMAKIYYDILSEINFIKCPPNNLLEKNRFDNYQNFEVLCTNRDQLRIFLKKKGIDTIIPWGGKCVHEFKNLKLANKDLSFTENILRKSILLPMNQFLSKKDVLYICNQVKNFYN